MSVLMPARPAEGKETMGTRSSIGMVNDDGTVTGIYCHWDGYPDHHVPILTECYTTREQVRALLALGDLSSLQRAIGEKHDFDNRTKGWCVAYGRDRGEEGTAAKTLPDESSFDRYAKHVYAYLFKDGQWIARSWDGQWKPAKVLLEETNAE